MSHLKLETKYLMIKLQNKLKQADNMYYILLMKKFKVRINQMSNQKKESLSYSYLRKENLEGKEKIEKK